MYVNIPVPWILHGYEDLGRIAKKIPRSSWGPQTQADFRFFEAYSFDAIEFAWEDGEGEQNEETGQGCGWEVVGWFATLPAGFLLVCL